MAKPTNLIATVVEPQLSSQCVTSSHKPINTVRPGTSNLSNYVTPEAICLYETLTDAARDLTPYREDLDQQAGHHTVRSGS